MPIPTLDFTTSKFEYLNRTYYHQYLDNVAFFPKTAFRQQNPDLLDTSI